MALHKHDCEEELSELVHEIIDSEQKIESWKKQIQDIKGVQRCEKCGAEIAQGSAFCSSCGAPVPKIQTSETVEMSTCKNCGASIKKGVRFCTSCGTKIDLEEGENTKAALSQENKDEEIETRVCPKCGAEIQNNNDFCTECGTKLQ